jgi:nicotinate-nucleotide adenylyltransferase
MIGVFGGTFDPIHFGHLRPALEVLQDLGLREIRFVPLNRAAHRLQPAASARQRLAMVHAALEGQPGFAVDEREVGREGVSYSYDTLMSLRAEAGPDLPICLLIGLDAFREFPSWHRPTEILGLAHLVVMRRPGAGEVDDPRLSRWVATRLAGDVSALARSPGGLIVFRQVTQLEISATAIRAMVQRGLSPRFLLPDAVLGIIEREALYRAQSAYDVL